MPNIWFIEFKNHVVITEDVNNVRIKLMNKIANEVSEEDKARITPKFENMGRMRTKMEEENPGYSDQLRKSKQQRLKSQATPDQVNM